MRQRVSLITLGVADLGRARAFYEALGWETGAGDEDDVVFFQAGEMVLALWDRERLAEDSGVAGRRRLGRRHPGAQLQLAARRSTPPSSRRASAGATVAREPAETFWGGYSGVFADPEGHPWEIAHNPRWTVTEDGGTRLG